MSRSVAEKRAAFRKLHEQGCFLLPNPWDVGSARLFQHLGFEALASTSSGYAWTTGRPDYGIRLEDAIEHLSMLCPAVDLPVNADFESGFAADLEGLAANVTRAIEAGVAGLSIEDRVVGDEKRLYSPDEALERLRVAKEAIDRSGADVILVARTEGLLMDGSVVEATERLVAFAEAGADCLYAPGVGFPGRSKDDIAAMARAVAPRPMNLLVVAPNITVAEAADLGVRRISVGSALAGVSWRAAEAAARQMKDGSFEGLSGSGGSNLNALFGAFG